MKKDNIKLFCLVCRREIPPERLLQHAPTTCGSKECARELKRRRMAHIKRVRCIYCGAPFGPAERREFSAWHKARGDHKKRGRKPKYSIPDPRQMDIPGIPGDCIPPVADSKSLNIPA